MPSCPSPPHLPIPKTCPFALCEGGKICLTPVRIDSNMAAHCLGHIWGAFPYVNEWSLIPVGSSAYLADQKSKDSSSRKVAVDLNLSPFRSCAFSTGAAQETSRDAPCTGLPPFTSAAEALSLESQTCQADGCTHGLSRQGRFISETAKEPELLQGHFVSHCLTQCQKLNTNSSK